jgi:hypothetical protein
MVALMQAGAQAPAPPYLEQKSLEPQVAQVLPPVLMLEQVLQVALQAQTQGQQVPASRSVLVPQAPLVSQQAVQPQVPVLPQAPQQQAQVPQVLVQQRAVQPVPLRVQQQLVRAQVL